jgi:HK97 family phage prohead protease
MTTPRALGYVDRASLADGSPRRVVMATEGRKADNIDLRMSGARLDRFRANPVLGYGHAYWGRENLPIGRVDPDTIDVVGTALAGSLSFDADDDFAVKVERKMRAGYVNAVSIGFDVLEWENGKGDVWRGGVATAWEMTELSVVPVPMDANAVVTSGRSLLDDADRAAARALVDDLTAEFGAERVLAALLRHGLPGGPTPERPAPPVQDPTPAVPAGVDPDAARALLAAFAKES